MTRAVRIPTKPPRAVKRKRAVRSEDSIQRAVFQNLRERPARRVFAFHVPNGGKRGTIEAAAFKRLGVLAGIPDVIAIKDGRVFALELKSEKGRVSAAQALCHEAMREAGIVVAVAFGLDSALAQLERWGLLRGGASSERTAA